MEVLELKNIRTEIKNTLDRLNCRMEMTEGSVNLNLDQYKLFNQNDRQKNLKKIKKIFHPEGTVERGKERERCGKV